MTTDEETEPLEGTALTETMRGPVRVILATAIAAEVYRQSTNTSQTKEGSYMSAVSAALCELLDIPLPELLQELEAVLKSVEAHAEASA